MHFAHRIAAFDCMDNLAAKGSLTMFLMKPMFEPFGALLTSEQILNFLAPKSLFKLLLLFGMISSPFSFPALYTFLCMVSYRSVHYLTPCKKPLQVPLMEIHFPFLFRSLSLSLNIDRYKYGYRYRCIYLSVDIYIYTHIYLYM